MAGNVPDGGSATGSGPVRPARRRLRVAAEIALAWAVWTAAALAAVALLWTGLPWWALVAAQLAVLVYLEAWAATHIGDLRTADAELPGPGLANHVTAARLILVVPAAFAVLGVSEDATSTGVSEHCCSCLEQVSPTRTRGHDARQKDNPTE